MPAWPTLRGGHLRLAQALGDFVEAHGLLCVGIPGTHVLHDGGVHRLNAPPARITRAFGIEQRAIGCARPRPQLPAAPRRLTTPAHPLGNQRALLLCHGRTHWQEQLSVGGLTHRALDTCDAAAPLGAFVDQEHLMHLVACSTLRGRDQHTCTGGHGRPSPEASEPGAVEFGPAITCITIDVLLSDMPLGVRRHVVAEATQVVRNRLLLWRTRRRDTGVQSDFHGVPPDEAMVQGWCLRCVP
jgi:hypothetical protein